MNHAAGLNCLAESVRCLQMLLSCVFNRFIVLWLKGGARTFDCWYKFSSSGKRVFYILHQAYSREDTSLMFNLI